MKENLEPVQPSMQENSDLNDVIITKHVDQAVPPKDKKKKKKKSKVQKIQDQKDKHPMLPSCSCKKKCAERIPEDLRNEIHNLFWQHDYNERLDWLHSKRAPVPIKRRRSNTKGMRERDLSYECFFF